jgi:hypothetical protein
MESNNKYWYDGKDLRGPLQLDWPKRENFLNGMKGRKMFERNLEHYEKQLLSLPALKVSEQLQKAWESEGKMVEAGKDFEIKNLTDLETIGIVTTGCFMPCDQSRIDEGKCSCYSKFLFAVPITAQPEKTYPATAKQLSDLWDAAHEHGYEQYGCDYFSEINQLPDKQQYFKDKFNIDI